MGFCVAGTGFTRVMQEILTPLASDYDVDWIGLGYGGPVLNGAVRVHPANRAGGDVFGVYQVRDHVERHRPDVVLLLNDVWILAKYMPAFAPFAAHSRVVCYCPLDGSIVDDGLVAPLAAAGTVVLYTEFARGEVEAAAGRLLAAGVVSGFPALDVIPHGVDTATFRPLAGSIEAQLAPGGRRSVRAEVFGDEPDWLDGFLVLNANRAQPRKRIDLTIEAFAHFAQGKPSSVRLCLHHAIQSDDEHRALRSLADRFGIADRVRLTTPGEPPLSDVELNRLYNACDVGINTALGEGWGLVSFEHAATGAAQVVPDHSACAELWTDAALLVDTQDVGVPRHSLLGMRTISPAGAAAALDRLYADRSLLRDMSLAAYHNACNPAYRWVNVAERWRALL